MIVLLGPRQDPPLVAVAAALRELGAACVVVDVREVAGVELDIDRPGAGVVRFGDGEVLSLESVGAVYLRSLSAGDDAAALPWAHALQAWAETTPASVLNRPSASDSNHAKPYQLGLIAAADCGFLLPDTLLTSDVDAARDFVHAHGGRVVRKPISGVSGRLQHLDADEVAALLAAEPCPLLLQQHVEGVDHRVHVVGEVVRCHRVVAQALDYRRRDARTQVVDVSPDDDLASRCRALSRQLGLVLAGIDLRRDAKGGWWCFEANPSPGFPFYEQRGAAPLAPLIAAHLAAADAQSGSA